MVTGAVLTDPAALLGYARVARVARLARLSARLGPPGSATLS